MRLGGTEDNDRAILQIPAARGADRQRRALIPIITKVGIDPVHFGVMMTLNLMIGLLHPPLGMVLFVLARIAKLSIERTTMAILPWLIPLLASLVAITLIPELTLGLPRLMGLLK